MRRWLSALPLLALPLLVIACAERAKAGAADYSEIVARDIPKIEKAIGVKFKTPPRLELRSRDQVREFLLLKMKEPNVQKELANSAATYKLLGMIPDTMHLDDLYVRVLTEQIIGYYDPKTKVLYVVKDAPEDYAGLTIMHELVHALQDQYVNMDSLQSVTGDDDRAAAIQAVIEGQATYEQMYITSNGSGNIAVQIPGGWERMRQMIREASETQPMLSSAPIAIKESLLFPYVNGADFVRRYKARRPGKLPFDSLPVSTEQLMHENAYFGTPPDVPSVVTLPTVANQVTQNNMGEFGTRLFVYTHTRDQDRSIRASNGWDGDRYVVVKTPSGNAIAWVTVWDTPTDAAEFVSAVDAVVAKRFFVKPRITGEKRHFDAGKRTIDVDVREIDGRTVVLYTEVPAGESTNVIDFSKVQVKAR